MTAPALPDVELERPYLMLVTLAEAVDKAPRCETVTIASGQRCEHVATWIARPEPVCCVTDVALLCDQHKAMFAEFCSCIGCGEPVGIAWERL